MLASDGDLHRSQTCARCWRWCCSSSQPRSPDACATAGAGDDRQRQPRSHVKSWWSSSQPTALDACHYTFSSISTVGYGDISPKTSVAKSWTIFYHMLTIILSLKLFDYYYNKDSVTLESLKNRVENLSLENVMLNNINNNFKK